MELILTVVACFLFMLAGAIVGSIASGRVCEEVVKPLISELHYCIKHVSAHDLQVYNGIVETDWTGDRPYIGNPPKTRGQMILDAEELARELDRYNGDLPASAE